MIDLGGLIDATPWIDTHEHLVEEHHRLKSNGYEFVSTAVGDNRAALPADWSTLIDGYSAFDLVVAGLPPETLAEVHGPGRSPLEKWDAIESYLALTRHTGSLRSVDVTTERLFGLRLSRETVEEIDARQRALRVEGYYARVLRDVANIAHCQVHTLDEHLLCESRQPDLLRQDLALTPLVFGSYPEVEQASGIEVGSLDDYVRMVEWCFERYAAQAVAVKCAWAYQRPLAMDVPQVAPRREFERLRAGMAEPAERRRVEDFLFRRCIELATDAGLPVKIHLGYLAGTYHAPYRHVYDHVRDIVPVVQANPSTTFVLMHIAWPQQEQLLALAKHQPNVMVDLCWAWIAAPVATEDFLVRALTTVPASKAAVLRWRLRHGRARRRPRRDRTARSPARAGEPGRSRLAHVGGRGCAGAALDARQRRARLPAAERRELRPRPDASETEDAVGVPVEQRLLLCPGEVGDEGVVGLQHVTV